MRTPIAIVTVSMVVVVVMEPASSCVTSPVVTSPCVTCSVWHDTLVATLCVCEGYSFIYYLRLITPTQSALA